MKRKALLVLIPVGLLILIALLRYRDWQRLHPPPTLADEQARNVLSSADYVKVEVISYEFVSSEGLAMRQINTPIANLTPGEMSPVTSYLNLTQQQSWCDDSGCSPTLFFSFYKGGKMQADIHIGDGVYGYEGPQSKVSMGLHLTTVRRLKTMIMRNAKMYRALLNSGVQL